MGQRGRATKSYTQHLLRSKRASENVHFVLEIKRKKAFLEPPFASKKVLNTCRADFFSKLEAGNNRRGIARMLSMAYFLVMTATDQTPRIKTKTAMHYHVISFLMLSVLMTCVLPESGSRNGKSKARSTEDKHQQKT